MNAPEQAIKIYRGDDTDWNGETLLNFTVTADFDISDFTAEFLLGGITKKNISLSDGGNFEVNFSHEETAQMPWGLNKGILKIFDADKRIKTVTNDILFWVTNDPVGEQTESIIVPVPETSPVQITLQIGGGSSGGGAWGSITGDIQNQADLQAEFAEVQGQINAIDGLIPAQASTDNKLADKNFVNSSISTNTAYFIGTFESVEALEAYSGTVTNNDYAFVVGTDSDGNTVYNRYKYTTATTPASWLFEYSLNNSSFTAAQWAAIQSGITSADVTQIGTNTNNIIDLQSDKQPKTLVTPITVDGTQQTTVEGALGAVNTFAGKGLANKATGTNSLTILGTAATSNNSINIGANSSAPTNNYATTVGNNTAAYGYGGISLGQYAQTAGHGAIAIGHGASVTGGTSNTRCSIAIGGSGDNNPSPSGTERAVVSNAANAIQLGSGTNSTSNSFQVFSYQMLDGNTGKIPNARLDNEYLTGISRCGYNFQQLATVHGEEYTAPANGFFVLNGVLANAANNRLYLLLRNKTYVYGNRLAHMAFGALSSYRQYVWLPVAKGDVVAVTAQSTAQTPDFDLRFYYAIGEQIPTPEHTPVQYIQGQYNAQYIKSGIIPTSGMKVYCKLQNTSSTLGFGWGCRNETYDGAQISINATNQNVVVDWFGADASDRWTLSTSVATTDIFECTIENNVATIVKNGATVGTHTFTPTAAVTRELFLTGFNNNGSMGGAGATGRLYEYKLWSPEGDLLLDMKPVKDGNNVACLYNSVNKILYYNQGIGSYAAGPEAN